MTACILQIWICGKNNKNLCGETTTPTTVMLDHTSNKQL
uniref:Uncharacterized protein n=1 Tax=Anguilla anguilla TaxID=7936 RepID=A0A0E9VGI9_ANGAN